MTNETIDTIEMLNSLAEAKSENEWTIGVPMILTLSGWRTRITYGIKVERWDNIFCCTPNGVSGTTVYHAKGFKFLEQLVDAFPSIIKRLAQP